MKTLLYWIDDSHDNQRLPRGAVKRQIEAGLGVVLKPDKTINDRAEFTDLLLGMNLKNTCGVIMDYQLAQVGEKRQMAFGTTWAAEIRAKYPSIPVIGISHCPEKDIPKFQLESFLAFFPRNQLTGTNPRIEDLRSLLNGYNDVYRVFKRRRTKSGVELMKSFVKPPSDVADLVGAAIPSVLRGRWDDETPHVAGRWLWHEFQGLPGFLFDELGLATHLGLNLKGLERVALNFNDARYHGTFASDGRPRWWVSEIRKIFEEIVGEEIVGQLSLEREKLLNSLQIEVNERRALLSLPHGRRNSTKIPECVAYGEDEREEDYRVQALLEDTVVDDRDANCAFGFEARRIYVSLKKK